MSGGWENPNDYQISCLQVRRDEDIFNESSFAQDFVSGKTVVVSCSALLLVPGKAVIGIA